MTKENRRLKSLNRSHRSAGQNRCNFDRFGAVGNPSLCSLNDQSGANILPFAMRPIINYRMHNKFSQLYSLLRLASFSTLLSDDLSQNASNRLLLTRLAKLGFGYRHGYIRCFFCGITIYIERMFMHGDFLPNNFDSALFIWNSMQNFSRLHHPNCIFFNVDQAAVSKCQFKITANF